MIKWSVFAGVCEAVLNKPEGFSSFRQAAVDSRKVGEGDLFIPLPGERTDGHHFIEDALARGAAGFIVSSDYYASHPESKNLIQNAGDKAVGVVSDTLKALQDMARAAMKERGKGAVKIGVTGSNGKTTTKELIGKVLSARGSAFVNEGNLNSEIGLCQEVLRYEGGEKFVVFEMGMNRKGEMSLLADIVCPDYAVITNIGTAHIGLIGSIEEIASEKKAIFSRFTGSEIGYIHEDEPFFDFLSRDVQGTILPYGRRSAGEGIIEQDRGLKGSEIIFPEGVVRFPLFGGYNRKNMYAAYELGVRFGIPFREIKESLESVEPLFGRSQIIEGDVTVIFDCYNANDDSMREALAFADGLPWKGKKAAVLGGMAELGDFSEKLHAGLGSYAAGLAVDILFFYGEAMRPAYEAAMASGTEPAGGRFRWFAEMEELGRDVESTLRPGDLLLLKGSRSIELERLLHYVKKEKSLC